MQAAHVKLKSSLLDPCKKSKVAKDRAESVTKIPAVTTEVDNRRNAAVSSGSHLRRQCC